MLIRDLVRLGESELTDAGVADCLSDVFLLLGHVLGKSRTEIMICGEEEAAAGQEALFLNLLGRRKAREPVAYILGEQEFWSLPFSVTPDVLIPRPETEFLLEKVLKSVDRTILAEGAIVDLCCGSGVIAIVLALELGADVLAIDISEGAVGVSRENCRRHGVSGRVRLVRSDLFSGFRLEECISLLVSNPPYVTSSAIRQELEPEVACYEPVLALDGGARGMDVIERIYRDCLRLLTPRGQIFMEIGWDQGELVEQLFTGRIAGERRFSKVEILKDYAGRDRVLHAIME